MKSSSNIFKKLSKGKYRKTHFPNVGVWLDTKLLMQFHMNIHGIFHEIFPAIPMKYFYNLNKI